MRVKGASVSNKKRKKLFTITKGYWGQHKNAYRRAREAYLAALSRAYADRKRKKRDFRRLWIARINAGARICGTNYSNLIHGLKLAGVDVNRKVLADLAITDMNAFNELVKVANNANA